jgi:hypothetical protein
MEGEMKVFKLLDGEESSFKFLEYPTPGGFYPHKGPYTIFCDKGCPICKSYSVKTIKIVPALLTEWVCSPRSGGCIECQEKVILKT